MIEPGPLSLVGNAGVCLTEVLYLKPGRQKNFCIVDAAMNDLPRPAMYQAYHAIVPLQAALTRAAGLRRGRARSASGDWLGRERNLARGHQATTAGRALPPGLLQLHGQHLQPGRARPGCWSMARRRLIPRARVSATSTAKRGLQVPTKA